MIEILGIDGLSPQPLSGGKNRTIPIVDAIAPRNLDRHLDQTLVHDRAWLPVELGDPLPCFDRRERTAGPLLDGCCVELL